ncbi:MAG: WhiB family transcriptional regulator [Acidimicrobiales bacterium]
MSTMDVETDWQSLAACTGADPDLFFPDRGELALAAKVVCAVCPVREQCLAHALVFHEDHGVWGGTTPTERRRLRRPRARHLRLSAR